MAGAAQGSPRVVVSIPPLFSLVDNIMKGVGSPVLVLAGGQSPHHASLSPSAVSAIYKAELLVWVGPVLESGIARVVDGLETVRVLTLTNALTDSLLVAGNPHRNHAAGDGFASSNPLRVDPHLWLSSAVSASVVRLVAGRLMTMDPDNADVYQRNTDALVRRLENWRRAAEQRLDKARGKPFMIFHDAYRYFEKEFGLNAIAAVTLNPERATGAKRLLFLRGQVEKQQIRCLFTEPQFEPDAARVIVENTSTRIGVLDPLGANLDPGPDMWFQLMDNLVDDFLHCVEQ